MSLLSIGAKAPDFSTFDQNGKRISLQDFLGKKVILFFYPKDNTSGCTKEACAFRDKILLFEERNVVVIGVSVDSIKSHKSFVDKYQLPFTLLSDTDKDIVEAYGVWGEKTLYGKKYLGTNRVTYLIDESGNIASVFPKVKPETHPEEILAVLEKM
ncbi:MAG: peroxiredoxin Q/BCP [bacterium]|nr:MAG: peroxiredoxin Q/BCP [bacterium]